MIDPAPAAPVANSRMYNITPDVRETWDALFGWIAETADVPLEIIAHAAPAPLDALWSGPDMGCVFMCGWPFAMASPQPIPVAVPVPSPSRYGHAPVYFTDLIVRRESPYRTIEDTFGGRVAWTVDNSHSGFNALRHHLLTYRAPGRETLYQESVGPVITPRASISSVLDGDADIAPVDSYVMDLLRLHDPQSIAGVRVVDTTGAAPFPPLVASRGIDGERLSRLSQAFLSAHEAPVIADELERLLIERFVTRPSESYAVAAERAAEAVAAGYARPG